MKDGHDFLLFINKEKKKKRLSKSLNNNHSSIPKTFKYISIKKKGKVFLLFI